MILFAQRTENPAPLFDFDINQDEIMPELRFISSRNARPALRLAA